MYTGQPLFNGKDPEDQLMKIVQLLGKPPESMRAQRQFFLAGTKEGDRIEAAQATRNFADRFRAIGYDCITRRKRADGVALVDDVKTDTSGRVIDENLLQFLDLVTKCLDLDPKNRILPCDALQHPFCQTPSKESPRPETPKEEASGKMQVDTEEPDASTTTGLEGSVSELEVVTTAKSTRSSARSTRPKRGKSH